MKQALSLAAGIFLLAAGWIVAEHFASPRIIITEEIQRPDLQIAVTSGDASAFRLVTQICQTKPFLCENYEVQLLQRELEELNRACQTLQREIHGVNTQPHLVATLTDLEMQRTEILKQLIALI